MSLRLPLIVFFICGLVTAIFAQDLFTQPTPPAPLSLEPSPSEQPKKVLPPQQPAPATDSELLQTVIENQLAAIRGFDISRAYYAYTTREFQKTVPLETFQQFVKKYSVFFRNKQITKEDIAFKGKSADYKGKLLSLDGEVYMVLIHFVNVDEEWKINSIKLEELPPASLR